MSPVYIHEKHDIGLVRSDTSIVVGLMLATIDGKPAYKTSTERYLKNQYYAFAPDYGALDPQSELPIILDDWRAGYGLEVAASADPGRYYSSIGMDARHRGMLIAGWTPTAIAQTYTWTNPTAASGWDNSANAINANTTNYASKEVNAGGKDWSDYLEFTFTSTEVGSIRYYIADWGGDASKFSKIDIDVWDGDSWEPIADEATPILDRWVGFSVALTTISKVQMRVYNNDTNPVTARFYALQYSTKGVGNDAVITSAFADFNDELYRAGSATLYKLNAAGDGFFPLHTFPAVITDLEPFTDNNLYIACGTASAYWYANTAEVLTASTAGTATYQFFATVLGAAPTLWGNDGVNTIRSNLAPASSAWSGTTTVGSSYHNITDLISWKGLLYIMKEDKPYYLDETAAAQDDLAMELESAQSATSGKNAWVWQNELHIPCGAQALLRTDAMTNTFINPSKYCTNLTDFAGRVYAGAGDEEWNYVIVENASTTEVEVMATRLEKIDGTTQRVWHPIAEITLKGCECCHISTEVDKRLWIASDDATDSLYYLPLPTTYGDIINDPNFKADSTDVFLITSGLHGGFKGEDKYWRKATATLGHTQNDNVYFELHYMKLGAGDYSDPADDGWIDVGNFVGSSASMSPTLYFPANSAKDVPVTPMMWLKLVGKTASTALTPILLNLDIRTILKPPARKIIECVVRCADKIKDKDGLYIGGTSATYIREVLDEARDSTVPFTFSDPWGAEHTCIMLPNELESIMQVALKNENPEQLYYLRMQEETIA